jgi:exopolysaccharide biosynthesis predicted pyruvyltransferase EpsI
MSLPVQPASGLVRSLQATIDECFAACLPAGSVVAHVGFPNHWNTGDPAIWLGTQAALARRGCTVAYQCAWQDYDRELMARQIGSSPILIAGGGNLGDLWPNHQVFRERILADFPDNPVIQMPQSICFEHERNLDRFRAACARHPRFHILLRERRSLALAEQSLGASVSLCPDMAFALGILDRPEVARDDVLWLLRSDKESQDVMSKAAPGGHIRRDWLELGAEDAAAAQAAAALNGHIQDLVGTVRASPARATTLFAALNEAYGQLAWLRVDRGLRLLSRGRVIATDRLHGHILGLCLGIPQVVLDNSYHKVSSTFETWTASSPITRWADSWAQADDHCRSLLGGVAELSP